MIAGDNPEDVDELIEVNSSHAQMFETAIANNSALTEDQKTILRLMFGL